MVAGVPDTSAIALHKHHVNLVKFTSADPDFETVADQIGIMVKNTPQKIDDNWKHEFKVKSECDAQLVDLG